MRRQMLPTDTFFLEKKRRFSVLNVRTLITQKMPAGGFPKGTPAGSPRAKKCNYAAVEALALSLVLALSATSEVLALSEALADSEVLADAEVLAGSEALVLAGSDTDVLDGAVEAGALEEEESVPQATRDSAISAATARTRTFSIVKTPFFRFFIQPLCPRRRVLRKGICKGLCLIIAFFT
mgnify:CR=1 FL=1